ncbi:MAG: hypothetical protein J7L38_06370 [Thermoproteales archaeon]|nr:hypothetical protein [Thermoproteales archaeon]
MKLRPLHFTEISGFFPGYNLEELLKIYGFVGGTPAYLEKWILTLIPKKTRSLF